MRAAVLSMVLLGVAGCGQAEAKDPQVAPAWAPIATLPAFSHPGLLPPLDRSMVIAVGRDGYLRVNAGKPIGINELAKALRVCAAQFLYEKDGSCPVPAVLHIDHGTSWRVVQWILQACSEPGVKMYRIYFAGTHAQTGRVGGYEINLPKDRGMGVSATPVVFTKFKVTLIAKKGDAETAAQRYDDMSRRVYALLIAERDKLCKQDPKALDTLVVEVSAPPPRGGLTHMGYVAGVIDAVYRADLRSILFEGAALPRSNDIDAETFRASARKTGRSDVLIKFNNTPRLTSADPVGKPLPTATFDETPVRHVMHRSDSKRPPEPAAYRAALRGSTFEVVVEELEEVVEDLSEVLEEVPASPGGVEAQGKQALNNAVQEALQWLAAHQSPNGGWQAADFGTWFNGKQITRDAQAGGMGKAHYDVGVTGLALYAFVEAGFTSTGKHAFAKHARSAADYLMNVQDPDGCFGARSTQQYIYNHALAALAMTTLYQKTRNPRFLGCVQRAHAFIAHTQNPNFAWRYGIKPGDNDTSVTSWMAAAIVAAERVNADAKMLRKPAPIELDSTSTDGIARWLDKVTDVDWGKVGYISRGAGSCRPQTLMHRFPANKAEALTAAGVWMRLQRNKTDPLIAKGAALCAKLPPTWNAKDGSIDMIYWLNGTRMMRALGGDLAKEWLPAMHLAATRNQRADGELSTVYGSWDPIGAWGHEGGRVYSTAVMALICNMLRK